MNNAKTAEIIKTYCKSKSISVAALLADCHIRKGLIYDMEKRDMTPSAEILEQIANYLDCSIDYLLGRTEIPEINTLDNMVRIYTAARSHNGDAYGEAEVQTVRQSLIDRLRAAPDASDDL